MEGEAEVTGLRAQGLGAWGRGLHVILRATRSREGSLCFVSFGFPELVELL